MILTLLFRRTNLHITLLLPEKTSDNVIEAIDMIEGLCDDSFSNVFPILLYDRGAEFANAERMEHSRNSVRRTRVYYCDPLQSQQKPRREKNHVEIRKVLPKGKSDFDSLVPRDMATLMSHVNSYARDILQWAAPYDLARLMLPESLLDGAGMERNPGLCGTKRK